MVGLLGGRRDLKPGARPGDIQAAAQEAVFARPVGDQPDPFGLVADRELLDLNGMDRVRRGVMQAPTQRLVGRAEPSAARRGRVHRGRAVGKAGAVVGVTVRRVAMGPVRIPVGVRPGVRRGVGIGRPRRGRRLALTGVSDTGHAQHLVSLRHDTEGPLLAAGVGVVALGLGAIGVPDLLKSCVR